jgi:hypothetical protein
VSKSASCETRRPQPTKEVLYFQVSLMVFEPEAGLVLDRLGSDSQVTWPLFFRMYLYSKLVLTGMFTVTAES